MDFIPDKKRYLVSALIRNPFELIRYLRVGWTTFRYRYLHRCAGPGTIVGQSVVLINTANIRVGSGCLLMDHLYIRAGVDGFVTIEDGVALNSFVKIFGHGGVRIGRSAQIGPGTILTTSGHDYRATELELDLAAIDIGERVWIGCNSAILPGVTIGDRAVIGAGAVVTSNIPSDCLAVGVPARVVRYFDEETAAKDNVPQPGSGKNHL
jgi:acetyltransferase-like isoleucine patch superfamily enzyme